MIVRDEERFLDDCLKSIAGEVDEIVVVDTGSIDATREIAKKYGSRLFDRPWTGNFSAERNFALEQASGDWVLYIDADERLVVPRGSALRQCVQRQDAAAFTVRFQPRVNFTRYQEIRLFRRDPRIRFHGVIHESMRAGIQDLVETDGLKIVDSDLGIDHVGYEGDMSAKYSRNLPLLEEAVKTAPERVFLWVDMAEALAGLGRKDDAIHACWHAIELAAASTIRKQKADGALAWRRLVALNADRPRPAADLASRAAAAYPDDHGVRLDLAHALFTWGEAEKVLPLVQALTAIDAETLVDPIMAYDKRIFGEWAFDLMGAAHARLGNRAAAADAFGRAAMLAPDSLAYRAKAAAFSR
jgi:Flp pilus assembly protein TadD